MRKLPALLAIIVVVPALAACSGSAAANCDAPFAAGDASALISATGDLGTQPDVSMPTPVTSDHTEVSTLIEGDGEVIQAGQPVLIEVSIYNGANGELFRSSPYDGIENAIAPVTAGSDSLPPATQALECATVGSRIAVVGTAEETHAGQASPENDIAANDALIYVVDIMDAYLAKADGASRAGANGDPTVVLAPDGTPGITVPKTDPPSDLVVSVLKDGDGEEIEDGDNVVLKYTGVTWADNEVFDSNWESGQASVFTVTEGSLIDGFVEGLVGQTIGSQVLLVIPPELGYGDQSQTGIPAGSTLVFVVDLLGLYE